MHKDNLSEHIQHVNIKNDHIMLNIPDLSQSLFNFIQNNLFEKF